MKHLLLNSPSMGFTVRAAMDLVVVEAGATFPLGFEIANRGDGADRFEVSVEGLDPEWVAIPVPTIAVESQDLHQEKVLIKPPRVSESLAGDYPFVLKVRSLESGDSRTSQGVLSVRPYHHLSIEIAPKRGAVSPFKKTTSFQATLMNLGNIEHKVQLFANDPEDELTFEFAEGQITLGPGHTRVVEVTAKPVKERLLSGARLHGFTVGARSLNIPSLVCSAQAQLEVRPLLSPGAVLLALTAGVLFFGWLRLLPSPPSIDSLSIDNNQPLRGMPVKVTWLANNATGVRISVNGKPLVDGEELEGSRTFVADQSGTVEAVAYRDNKASERKVRPFTVVLPIDPKIELFDIIPKNLKLGQTFLVKYKFNEGVVRATLSPGGEQLDPKLDQKSLKADLPGEVTYELVAENAVGKVDRQSITVIVTEASKAGIIVFRADPIKLPEGGGWVKVTWQVARSSRTELGVDKQVQVVEGETGEKEIFIDTDTELSLTAYDSEGNPVKKIIKIDVQEPPIVIDPSTTGRTTG